MLTRPNDVVGQVSKSPFSKGGMGDLNCLLKCNLFYALFYNSTYITLDVLRNQLKILGRKGRGCRNIKEVWLSAL